MAFLTPGTVLSTEKVKWDEFGAANRPNLLEKCTLISYQNFLISDKFFLGDPVKGVIPISQAMECMCLQCGVSIHLAEADIVMEDPASVESKLLDALLVCQNCGGQLALVGKTGDEPHYRLK